MNGAARERPRRRPGRILFLSPGVNLYGAEISLLHVVRLFSPDTWQLSFVVPESGPFEQEIRRQGWAVDFARLPAGRGLPPLRWPATLLLARLIRRIRPDLVHLNLHLPWPVASAASMLAGIPLVIHVRNMINLHDHGATGRFLFRRAAAYICISEAVRDRMLASDLADGSTATRVKVIHDGRDLSPFEKGNRQRFRAELAVAPGTPVIGMVARLEPMKGQDIFLEAARLVARRIPEARFVLVGEVMRSGDEAYRRRLEELAKADPLEGRVSFLGYRTDVPDILAGLDCFVHSSRRGAFVSVLIEAMAAGLPIVASEVDGIPECVGRDGQAELVTGLEPAAFADAIVRVVTDSARTGAMVQKARERARRLYDAEPLARATEAVFNGVLND